MTERIEHLLAENRRLVEERDYGELLREVTAQEENAQSDKEDSLIKVTKDQFQ